MSLTVDFDAGQVIKRLTALRGATKTIMPVAYQTFYATTPKRSGNAKNHTRLVGNTIRADYPYAGVLDAGRGFRDGQMRGSTQAPKGMTQPTLATIRAEVKKFIKKITGK